MSWADAWPSREDQRATTLAMKLGGRRLVARRHSGVDVGVCGDGYRQIRPSVAGSCLALACGRRRGGGEGVSPPWRRSAGASVTAIVRQSPPTIFLKNHLKRLNGAGELPRSMVREAPGRRRRPGSWLQSASTRPLCEYGSCQCTRLTDVSSEAGLCLITAVLEKPARNPATRAGEADFLKRS